MGFQVSTCPGCACGCGVLLEEQGGFLAAAYPLSSHPVSKSSLCIRGWNSVDSWRHPDRLTTALLRDGETLRPASADLALDRVSSYLKHASPGSVCFAVAPSISNEGILAIRRLAHDLRARVCSTDFSGVPTARRALEKALGRHYFASSLEGVERARLVWIFGADLENYPQVASAVTEAESNGARVVCFDVFSQAEKKSRQQVFVPPEEFLLLALLLQKSAIEATRVPSALAASPGFAELAALYHESSWLPSSSVLEQASVRELVDGFTACPDSAVVIGDRWLTTGTRPLEQTAQLIQAIALLGAEDRLVVAAGEVNSWGLADLLATSDSDSQIMSDLLSGRASDISVLVVWGDDLLRAAPCPQNLEEALGLIDKVVVLDRFESELTAFADVVLPSASFAEQDGTVTSAFGTVQAWRKALLPAGEARPEWEWMGALASRLGLEHVPATPLEWWMAEQASESPYDVGAVRLVYTGDSAGCVLREPTRTTFAMPSGTPAVRALNEPSVQAFFTRHPANWKTGAWTTRDEILKRESPEQALSVSPADLEGRGIKSGGRVRLVTQEGSAVFPARADSRLPRGVVSLAEVPGSRQIPRCVVADPGEGLSFQPVPCRLEKV